jgi:hypothetical protein
MKHKIIIEDNVFSNPFEIRNFLLSISYNRSSQNTGWKGFRSNLLNDKIEESLIEKIKVHLNLDKIKSYHFYGHYSLENTKLQCFPDFYSYGIHTDPSEYAGVIYLNDSPKKDCGTSFFDTHKNMIFSVDNIFNRMVIYNSNLYHRPTDLFGKDIYDSRLTLTFFLSCPKIPLPIYE